MILLFNKLAFSITAPLNGAFETYDILFAAVVKSKNIRLLHTVGLDFYEFLRGISIFAYAAIDQQISAKRHKYHLSCA